MSAGKDTRRRLMDAEAEANRPSLGTLLGLGGIARRGLLAFLLLVLLLAVTLNW